MHPDAIIQAENRVGRAARALEGMKAAQSPDDLENYWGEFLMAAGSFYSKLENGAKAAPKSGAWFGRKKHERKIDEVLRYVHHARNSDEHGIKRITVRQSSKVELPPGAEVKLKCLKDGVWTVIESNMPLEFADDIVSLERVHDEKHDDWYEVPTQHLGQPLKGPTPISLAELTLAYLSAMLGEAKGL
jgi:hypothetical protein